MPQKRTSEKEIVVSAGGTGAAPARSRRKAAPPAPRAKRTEETPAAAALPVAVSSAATESVVLETVAATATYEPGREEIAALAYSLWEARGYQGGSPEEDWLRAEEELRARAARA